MSGRSWTCRVGGPTRRSKHIKVPKPCVQFSRISDDGSCIIVRSTTIEMTWDLIWLSICQCLPQHTLSLAADIKSHLTMLQQMQPLFNSKLSDKLSRSETLKGHGRTGPCPNSGQYFNVLPSELGVGGDHKNSSQDNHMQYAVLLFSKNAFFFSWNRTL
jgi:hypothetical protein